MDQNRKQFMGDLREFLRAKWRTPEVDKVVHRHEVVEVAHSAGMGSNEAWRLFKAAQGTLWDGEYLPESRSEERDYTAVRLGRVA